MSESLKDRVPLAIALTALALAILGLTPIGDAASTLVQRVGFARDTRAVNGIQASKTPRPNRLLPLGTDARFPPSVIPQRPGLRGPAGAQGERGPVGSAGPDGGRALVVHRDDAIELPPDASALSVLTFDDLEAGAFALMAAVEISSPQPTATRVRCSFVSGGTEVGHGVTTVGTGPGGAAVATLPMSGTIDRATAGTVVVECAAQDTGGVVDVERAQASALQVASVERVEVIE